MSNDTVILNMLHQKLIDFKRRCKETEQLAKFTEAKVKAKAKYEVSDGMLKWLLEQQQDKPKDGQEGAPF